MFCVAATAASAKADNSVYPVLEIRAADFPAAGTALSAHKGGAILKLPVHTRRMVRPDVVFSWQGLGETLGRMGPRKTMQVTPGHRFAAARWSGADAVFCEFHSLDNFVSCLVDRDEDGAFEAALQILAEESFRPGRVLFEKPLDAPVPYSDTGTLTPFRFALQYTSSKTRPRLTGLMIDRNNVWIPGSFVPEPTRAPKGTALPHDIAFGDVVIGLVKRGDDKVLHAVMGEPRDITLTLKGG